VFTFKVQITFKGLKCDSAELTINVKDYS